MMKFNNKDINKMYIGDTLVNRVNDGDFQYMDKHDYSQDYLTFVALEDGVYILNNLSLANDNLLYYSIDDGETWSIVNVGNDTPTINNGERIMLKAENLNIASNGIGRLSITKMVRIEGNIMSLGWGDNFTGQTVVYAYNYKRLFFNNIGIIDASDLILPATTLGTECYRDMFNRCSNLTTAPALPATALVDYCYRDMFRDCTSLNNVKCLATDISANNCTWNWLNGVAASGTFVKAASMNDWPSGDNGIPSGWTIENVL